MKEREKREIQLKALQAALIAGEKSGVPMIFDSEAFLKRMRDKYVRKPLEKTSNT